MRDLVQNNQEALIKFTQRLVQTPSMPGEEGQVAALIKAELELLGYDQVWLDEVGNVIGCLKGSGGPSLMLNGHMDHVAAGDAAQWLHPPFGAEIHDGQLWGRASVDMKGALAAMVYAGGLLKKLGLPLPGDLYVTGVVQEEVGGLGAQHLAATLPIERAIVGESSDNQLRRGHRGRVEFVAHFEGRAVHASMPHLGINPHHSMSRFISLLRDLDMVTDADYGASTVAPTRVTSQPVSANVTPASLHLALDWRNIPGESPDQILKKLEQAISASLEPGCMGRIELVVKHLTSYTGFEMSYADIFPSFTTPADDPWLQQAGDALSAALGRELPVGTWRFATDGGHFAAVGTKVIGFGPGSDALVHTAEECLPVDQLLESVLGYMALSLI
jgi:putative selenium metabolism hydrolase